MKLAYRLTKDAEKDLRGIFRYTLDHWGEAQVRSYQSALNDVLDAIGNGQAIARPASPAMPQVSVVRCKKHFVFYLAEDQPTPVVIAIIHEKQDAVRHLAKRLRNP